MKPSDTGLLINVFKEMVRVSYRGPKMTDLSAHRRKCYETTFMQLSNIHSTRKEIGFIGPPGIELPLLSVPSC